MSCATPGSDTLAGRPVHRARGPRGTSRLWHWIPICPLTEQDRPAIEQHLLGLGAHDRYLRFGYPASDERIRAHVAQLDFTRHELFGIVNRRLQLVAVAHLAYADEQWRMAEFAVSVAEYARGRAYGKRLFQHAVRHCRNRHVHELFIHALSENTAMLRIVKGAGAKVRHQGGESEAWLELPPDSLGTHVGEAVETHAATLNRRLKLGSPGVARAVRALRGLKSRLTAGH